ncbi:hypothetical protein FOA52_005096 [Chlamydomonas sp. UWO 241]|nr:hypothetical protein FOA52_005096 [Chlamydomonas sp. UWO 241]
MAPAAPMHPTPPTAPSPLAYNLYIYDRAGKCLHYQEWHRPKSVRQGAGTQADDQKQMFGLFWTLSNFCATLNPKDPAKSQLGQLRSVGDGCGFSAFTASTYKMHFLETPSGVKFVLNTARDVGSCRALLQSLYDDVFVGVGVRSPFYVPGEGVSCDQFDGAVAALLAQRGLLPAV